MKVYLAVQNKNWYHSAIWAWRAWRSHAMTMTLQPGNPSTGRYGDRVFCLAETTLWPTKENNPKNENPQPFAIENARLCLCCKDRVVEFVTKRKQKQEKHGARAAQGTSTGPEGDGDASAGGADGFFSSTPCARHMGQLLRPVVNH